MQKNKELRELEKEFLKAQKNKKIALGDLHKCFVSADPDPVNWTNYHHLIVQGRSRFQ